MLLPRRHCYCGGSSTPSRQPIRREKAENGAATDIYLTYLSYFWVFAASLAHERLQYSHVSVSCPTTVQPTPAHSKLIDEKRY